MRHKRTPKDVCGEAKPRVSRRKITDSFKGSPIWLLVFISSATHYLEVSQHLSQNSRCPAEKKAHVHLTLQGIKLVLQVGTVEVLLTDTLVSGQLYLQPPSQNPILSPPIVTLHFYIPVSGQLLLDTFFVSRGCPVT